MGALGQGVLNRGAPPGPRPILHSSYPRARQKSRML
jgi:hypothetical protein